MKLRHFLILREIMTRLLFSPILLFFCLVLAVSAQEQMIDFEDKFEGKLQDGWSWVRENEETKRFAENALEIRMEPFADVEAKNVLSRLAPKRIANHPYAVELNFRCTKPFSKQYQQTGLYWVQNNKTVFKFVRELIDGQLYVFPGKIPVTGDEVTLKVIVNGENVVAEFQPEGETVFRRVYEGKLPAATDDEQIGIQCWHGPENEDSWIRFKKFRIFKHDEK